MYKHTNFFFGQRNWKNCKYAHILPFHEIYSYRIIINYDDKGHCRTHKCNFVAIIVWRWWEVVYWRRCAENCIDFIFMAWRKNWHRRIERFIDLLSSSAFNGDFFEQFRLKFEFFLILYLKFYKCLLNSWRFTSNLPEFHQYTPKKY